MKLKLVHIKFLYTTCKFLESSVGKNDSVNILIHVPCNQSPTKT